MNYSTYKVSTRAQSFLLTAAWIWPGIGEAVGEGALFIEGDQIKAVLDKRSKEDLLKEKPGLEVLDCQDSVVTPGLFNLHTHLDYTRVSPIALDLPLFAWLKELVGQSRRLSNDDFETAARAGARLAAMAGTTYVVDSSFSGSALAALAAIGLKGMVGLELFGLDEKKAEKHFAFWLERRRRLLDTAGNTTIAALEKGSLKLTVAPHAPYTVAPTLWKLADDWAAAENLMLTAHLAETREEIAWVGGDNPTVDGYLQWVMPADAEKETAQLLKELTWRRAGLSPVALLAEHQLLSERLLAAHCVHLSEADYQVLAARKVRAALCRRSNSRLLAGCPQPEKFSRAGIAFGLGTDSLASCQDLSPLAEAAAWWQQGIEENEALRWVTVQAADSLGLSRCGRLAAGCQADLAIFAGPSRTMSRQEALPPARYLLQYRPEAWHLMVDGEFVIREGKVLSDS